jgi:cytidylate kinase
MPARVICVSQAAGSGGIEIARIVASRLGFRHVDEEIVREAAAREGLPPEVVGDVERRRSFVERMLDALGDVVPPEGLPGLVFHRVPADHALRELIREVIRDTADEGRVVISSHAASLALAGTPDLLRVLVTASPELRARRIEGPDPLGFEDARKRVAEEDEARAAYLRRFYGVHVEAPTAYDLVVSTDVLTLDQAASVVVAAATL